MVSTSPILGTQSDFFRTDLCKISFRFRAKSGTTAPAPSAPRLSAGLEGESVCEQEPADEGTTETRSGQFLMVHPKLSWFTKHVCIILYIDLKLNARSLIMKFSFNCFFRTSQCWLDVHPPFVLERVWQQVIYVPACNDGHIEEQYAYIGNGTAEKLYLHINPKSLPHNLSWWSLYKFQLSIYGFALKDLRMRFLLKSLFLRLVVTMWRPKFFQPKRMK